MVMKWCFQQKTEKAQNVFHVTLHQIALVAGVVGVYTAFRFKHEVGDHLLTWFQVFFLARTRKTVCFFGQSQVLPRYRLV